MLVATADARGCSDPGLRRRAQTPYAASPPTSCARCCPRRSGPPRMARPCGRGTAERAAQNRRAPRVDPWSSADGRRCCSPDPVASGVAPWLKLYAARLLAAWSASADLEHHPDAVAGSEGVDQDAVGPLHVAGHRLDPPRVGRPASTSCRPRCSSGTTSSPPARSSSRWASRCTAVSGPAARCASRAAATSGASTSTTSTNSAPSSPASASSSPMNAGRARNCGTTTSRPSPSASRAIAKASRRASSPASWGRSDQAPRSPRTTSTSRHSASGRSATYRRGERRLAAPRQPVDQQQAGHAVSVRGGVRRACRGCRGRRSCPGRQPGWTWAWCR